MQQQFPKPIWFSGRCPSCGQVGITTDEEAGEELCLNCGFVVVERKALASAESIRHDGSGNGGGTTLAKPYMGLSREIGMRDGDGKAILFPDIEPLRVRNRWASRREERNFAKAFASLRVMADRFAAPGIVREEAARFYRLAYRRRTITSGRSAALVMAACLYAAMRNYGVTRNLRELAEACNFEERKLAMLELDFITKVNS